MATHRYSYEVEDPEAEIVENDETLAPDRERLASALRSLEAARTRVERDASRVRDETRSKLVADLLPVLDNVDRAIVAAESSGDAAAVVNGVRMVRRQLESVLLGYGLARFDAVGAVFDPALHDATSMIPVADPDQDHRVVDQLEPGYMFGDRLLRAAKVIVGRHLQSSARFP
jgi:molecular chaperone GrpE